LPERPYETRASRGGGCSWERKGKVGYISLKKKKRENSPPLPEGKGIGEARVLKMGGGGGRLCVCKKRGGKDAEPSRSMSGKRETYRFLPERRRGIWCKNPFVRYEENAMSALEELSGR